MLDVGLIEDGVTGEFDLSISPIGDLVAVSDFSTSILTSLMTDGRASERQVAVPQFRRGWIGDAVPPTPGYKLGSLLWLIEPSKATQATMVIAAQEAKASLQWMLDRKIARDIQVTGEITGPRQGRLTIAVTAPDGSINTQYLELWRSTAFQPSALPQLIQEQVPFDPAQVAGLVVWGDAMLSQHTVDDNCGVSVARDLANNADYFQAVEANRPQILRGADGWLYRFDGVNDFLATVNQPFPNLESGSAFFIYKPTSGATAGRRFFALGENGQVSGTGGMAFVQEAANAVRALGAAGSLDVSIIGPADNDLPIGLVFRWGPASAGADVEGSNLNAASDPSYASNVGTISQAVLGAGFDGADPDPTEAAGFELNVFAFYSLRVTDVDVLQLLDYATSRLFTSPVGEPAGDCFYPTDNFGFVDG